MNRGTPMSNSEARKALAEAQRGDEAEDVSEVVHRLAQSFADECEDGCATASAGWVAHRDDAEALLAAHDAEQRRLGAEAVVAAVTETCREWPEDADDRCNVPADFILWGKLFPREALGPRCYDHAVEHTHHTMPSRADQWAVFDLRAARAAAQQVSER